MPCADDVNTFAANTPTICSAPMIVMNIPRRLSTTPIVNVFRIILAALVRVILLRRRSLLDNRAPAPHVQNIERKDNTIPDPARYNPLVLLLLLAATDFVNTNVTELTVDKIICVHHDNQLIR